MLDALKSQAPETISTGESSYSLTKRKDGLVSLRSISNPTNEIVLPKDVGAKVYELMEMQFIAEKHLTDPRHMRKFGETFIRFFPAGKPKDPNEDPVQTLHNELTSLNCHWLGRTFLPERYYSISSAPRQKFERFEDFSNAIATKRLPWVGQVFEREKGVDESGEAHPVKEDPLHTFVALASDAGRIVCFEKIGSHNSFRIVPLEHIYRAWQRVLHVPSDNVNALAPAAEPYFAFSAEAEEQQTLTRMAA